MNTVLEMTAEQMINALKSEVAQRDREIAHLRELTRHSSQEHSILVESLEQDIQRLQNLSSAAYEERNHLVALLAKLFPSGTKRTEIAGWDEQWHGCVYIDFPWGQASWHYHDRDAHMFDHLPAYHGQWDGHSTDEKYTAILAAVKHGETGHGEIP